MRRIRMKLNRIPSLPERKRVGRKIIADLSIKLQMGWNPFTEKIAPKAYALMFETLDKFLAVKTKDSRPDTVRGYTSYVKIFKKWLLGHGFDETSYVCSFSESDAIDFMDDRDPAVSAKTYNNSILFFRVLFNWMIERKYIKDNPFMAVKRKPKRLTQKTRRLAAMTPANRSRNADICIADTGGTILGSYACNPRTAGIESDIEAVQSALYGISAKNLPEAENHGFGLRTTVRMLTAGLSGEYLLASGDALFAASGNAVKFVEIPFGVRFHGTVIAFRIPKIVDDFDYMKYESTLKSAFYHLLPPLEVSVRHIFFQKMTFSSGLKYIE